MKKIFYWALIFLVLFELANVFFIMPMPGSQETDSIDLAYRLYRFRWIIRLLLGVGLLTGVTYAWKGRKWLMATAVLLSVALVYAFNKPMTAAEMFKPMQHLKYAGRSSNKIPEDRIVIGVTVNNVSHAYPIQIIGYHHRVQDTLNGKIIFVTYCTVCHTGRVYEPVINGKTETFRLVGMDHYNAMFEDRTTNSWFRQSTGECVAGKLKGVKLPEVACEQMTLKDWFDLHPDGEVLQYDPVFTKKYDQMGAYETGGSKSRLTRIDSQSWTDKSLVLGIQLPKYAAAYDWNRLKQKGWIADTLSGKVLLLMIHPDRKGFSAFWVPGSIEEFKSAYFFREKGALEASTYLFTLQGEGVMHSIGASDSVFQMKRAQVFQEYWHSWRSFHPGTVKRKGI